MFTTKACYKLGLSSILYLVFALAFNVKAFDVSLEDFGCESDFKYQIIQSNKKQPVWSDKTIGSKEIETSDLHLDGNIEKALKKVFSEENIMNEMSLFSKFVKDYYSKKNYIHSGETLENFFNLYDVPFEPKAYFHAKNKTRKTTNPASYLIQELQELKEIVKSSKNFVSPYLVSAYVDPIGVKFDLHDTTSISDNIDKLRNNPVQDHLAAVIKINSGDRTGYLLMDPGYVNEKKLLHPFIVYVMEDGKRPHGDFLAKFKNNNKEIEFTVGGGKDNSYIVAKHLYAYEVRNVLYYVQKPYCSFMENTVKANLMRLNHGIIARGVNGFQQAYLWFKISKQFEEFGLRNLHTNARYEKTMKFKNVTEEDKKDIEKYFKISRGDDMMDSITNELNFIRENVMDKKNFIKEFINLASKLGLAEREKSFLQSIMSGCFGSSKNVRD